MAIIFHSGIETKDLTEFSSTSGNVSVDTTTKHTGGASVRFTPAGTNSYCNLGGSPNRIKVSIYVATAPAVKAVIIGYSSFNTVNVRMDTDRTLEIWNSSTLKGAGTGVIPLNTWTDIDVCLDPDTANDPCKLYINRVEDISCDTDGATRVVASVRGSDDANLDIYFDDIVCDDTASTAALGDIRTLVSIPDGAGTYAEFDTRDPTAEPDHWQNIDDAPGSVSDADYNADTLKAAVRDTYTLESSASAGLAGTDVIKAVTFLARMYGDNVDATAGFTVRDDGTDYESLFIMTDDAANFYWESKTYDTNAPRASAWTQAIFDAIEAGMYHGGDSDDSAISVLYAMIAFTPAPAVVTTEYGLHAIERAAVAGINTASRLGGWMEY